MAVADAGCVFHKQVGEPVCKGPAGTAPIMTTVQVSRVLISTLSTAGRFAGVLLCDWSHQSAVKAAWVSKDAIQGQARHECISERLTPSVSVRVRSCHWRSQSASPKFPSPENRIAGSPSSSSLVNPTAAKAQTVTFCQTSVSSSSSIYLTAMRTLCSPP